MIVDNINGFSFDENANIYKVSKELRKLSDDEVLIKNTFVGLNPVDWKYVKKNNNIIGVDGVGIAVYSNDSRININARYAYHCNLEEDGSFADYTIVKSKALIPVPNYISDVVACSIPCPALTAIQAIKKIPNLKNKNVIVNGSGGMVGRILSSLLVDIGANVYSIASDIHHKDLYDYGVLKCFNYNDVIDINNLYCVFDTTGKADIFLNKISYYGHIVSILGRIENNNTSPFTTCVSLHEIALGAIYQYGSREDFEYLISDGMYIFDLIAKNKILLSSINVLDFDDIPNALDRLKKGAKGIKFVARIN